MWTKSGIAAAGERNRWGPRADRLQIAFACNEGSGATLTNRGKGKWGSANGTCSSNRWASDADGNYIGAAGVAGEACDLQAWGSNYTVNRGTVLIRVASTKTSSGNPLLVTYKDGTAGANDLLITGNTTTAITVTFRDNANNTISYTWTTVNGASALTYTIIVQWGEGTQRAWLDGVLGTLTGTPNTDPLTWKSGEGLRALGSATAASSGRLYCVGLWDWELTEKERRELWSDPYLPFRPKNSVQCATYVNPVCTRPTQTGARFSVVTASDLAGTAGIGVSVVPVASPGAEADWLTAIATLRAKSAPDFTASGTTPGVNLDLSVTGLAAGMEYLWLAHWLNGAVYAPMCGGLGRFRTQRTPTDATVFNAFLLSDDHIAQSSGGGSYDDPEVLAPTLITDGPYGADILASSGATELSRRKCYAAWAIMRDAASESYDFILHLGDHLFTAHETSYADRFAAAASWRNFWAPLLKTAGLFVGLGNHDGEAGYMQMRDDDSGAGTSYRQQECTILRRMFLPMPIGGGSATYSEGGEIDSDDDWKLGKSGADPEIGTNPLNDTPLENYYGFSWGPALFCVLDPYRYTLQGIAYPGETLPSRSWKLGTTQSAWLDSVLRNTAAGLKVVCLHNLLGGEAIGITDGDDFYGRGSGRAIATDAEMEFHRLMLRHRVQLVLKAHDHKFAYARVRRVNYVTLPAIGANLVKDDATRGWNWSEMLGSYGKPHLRGENLLKRCHNTVGYAVLAVDGGLELAWVQSMHTRVIDLSQSGTPADPERYLADLETPASSTTYLPDRIPRDVAGIAHGDDGYWDESAESFTFADQHTPKDSAEIYEEAYNNGELVTFNALDGGATQVRALTLPRELYRFEVKPGRSSTLTLTGVN